MKPLVVVEYNDLEVSMYLDQYLGVLDSNISSIRTKINTFSPESQNDVTHLIIIVTE